ncbi:MAG TPA: hypothetical protein VGE67_12765 [Haloferula sp.]
MPIPERPIYRWKSFWLGLLVLAFLSWAWWNSFQRAVSVTRFQSGNFYQFMHVSGETLLRHGPNANTTVGKSGKWGFGTGNMTDPGYVARVKVTHPTLAIPDAAIVGLYTLCFATLILWRTRRWKRHADHTLTP